jgi:hypothetical protein
LASVHLHIRTNITVTLLSLPIVPSIDNISLGLIKKPAAGMN